MSRRRLPPEQRRAQLVEVASGVFAREGYGGARLEDVAREAGVSAALMSRHWPGGKAALFNEVRQQIRAESTRVATEALDGFDGTTAERVARIVPALVEWNHVHVDTWRLLAPEPMVPLNEDADLDTIRALLPGALEQRGPEVTRVALLVSRAIAYAFRSAMETMHSDDLPPGTVAVTATLYLVGMLDGLAEMLGGRLDGAQDMYDHASAVARRLGPDPDPSTVAAHIAVEGWPPLRLPAGPAPWAT